MMTTSRQLTMLTALVLWAAAPAGASSFLISLDTSSLSGTQTIAFGLTNSDAASNTVSLSDFDFGGGGPVVGTQDCTFGGLFSGFGCSGDLATSIDLQDLDVVALFTQQFDPGASLSFTLMTTNNLLGGVPDQFAMFLCDADVTTCYSDDLSTAAMLLLDLVGGTLSTSNFVVFGAADQNLPAPEVSVASVPEPATVVLLGGALACAAMRRQRQSRSPCSEPLDQP
jgi:hypothetical protein